MKNEKDKMKKCSVLLNSIVNDIEELNKLLSELFKDDIFNYLKNKNIIMNDMVMKPKSFDLTRDFSDIKSMYMSPEEFGFSLKVFSKSHQRYECKLDDFIEKKTNKRFLLTLNEYGLLDLISPFFYNGSYDYVNELFEIDEFDYKNYNIYHSMIDDVNIQEKYKENVFEFLYDLS